MASPDELTKRFSDFLSSPREQLDFEIKQWLNLGDENHRGLLAKAMIAMENHGGGYVLIGYEKGPPPIPDEANRPVSLDAYSTDALTGILKRYAEPPFHVDVVNAQHPTTQHLFPVVIVSGLSKVPVRTCSQTQDNKTLLQNTYYIRRPGPSSEGVRSGQEWDELLRRCLTRQRDEMLAAFRAIMAGEALGLGKAEEPDLQKKKFLDASWQRWEYLKKTLAQDHPGRLAFGRYWFNGKLQGNVKKASLPKLLETISNLRRYSGWPPFWVPTRNEIAPYVQDDVIECWLGQNAGDPGHADFWRVATDGSAFLLRGFQEDGLMNDVRRQLPPKQVLDLTIPVWRVAEVLLRYNELASKLTQGDYSLEVAFGFEGLSGRRLVALNPNRLMFDERASKQDTYLTNAVLTPQAVQETLPETVDKLLRGMYELFDFFTLPQALPREEISRLLSGRF